MKQINKSITVISVASLLAVNSVHPILASANTNFQNSDTKEERNVEEELTTKEQTINETVNDYYELLEEAEEISLTGTFESSEEYRNVYNIDSNKVIETSLESLQKNKFDIIKKIQVNDELIYFVKLDEKQIMWVTEEEIILEEKPVEQSDNETTIDESQPADVEKKDNQDSEDTGEINGEKNSVSIQEEPAEGSISKELTDNQVRALSSNVSSQDIQYQVEIKEKGYSIDTVPWGYEGYKKVGDSASYINKRVTVLRETTNGAYANIAFNGIELGWIDKRAFNMVAVKPYKRTVVFSGYSIDSAPWGSDGYYKISNAIDQIFNEITVVGESKSKAYVYIVNNGVGIGWIDKRALGTPNLIERKVITSQTHSIDSAPWGQYGYKQLTTSKNNLYQEVEVMLRSSNGAYSLIRSNGKYLGWIDNRALNKKTDRMTLSIVKSNYSIDSLPWGEKGYKKIGSTGDYLNKRVEIVAVSNNDAYVLITSNGNQVGWIDKRALSINASSYPSVITTSGYSIDTLPWGTVGSKKVSQTDNYIAKNVKVVSETSGGAYLLVVENGKELGWVDHRALGKAKNVAGSIPVDYSTTISRAGYSIDTLPWGMNGFKKMSSTSTILGTGVKVTYHYKGYALLEINGAKYGWVDKKALANSPQPQNAVGQQNVYYNAVIKGNYSIDTLPWGTKGYQKLSHTSLISGKTVKVLRITKGYAYISLNGNNLGWVDRKAIGNPVVYIDPGHGGSFPGTSGGGIYEKTLNLSTAKILSDTLKNRGYNVIMTRNSDTQFSSNLSTDLTARSRMANSGNGAIFVSIHYNSMGVSGTAKGIETFIQNSTYTQNRNDFNTNDPRINSSLRLADSTHKKIISYTNMYDRGVRAQNLNVLRNTEMTAVLYELGFMSNTSELSRIKTRQYQETATRAIADGIDQYFLR